MSCRWMTISELTLAAATAATAVKSGVAWEDGIASELKFWDDWLRTKGANFPRDKFDRRVNSSTPFMFQHELLRKRAPGQARFLVLDVGSGPLEGCGFAITAQPGLKMEIVPVDPLAKAYEGLLQRHGVAPVVRTWPLKAEELTNRFNQNFFDCVLGERARPQ